MDVGVGLFLSKFLDHEFGDQGWIVADFFIVLKNVLFFLVAPGVRPFVPFVVNSFFDKLLYDTDEIFVDLDEYFCFGFNVSPEGKVIRHNFKSQVV